MRLPVGGTGINVFRPVYRDGAPTATVAERRAALIGFAGGAFHVPDLAAAATDRPARTRSTSPLIERGRPVAGPDLPRDESGRPRRSTSPTAPGCWSCAIRAGPASTCR